MLRFGIFHFLNKHFSNIPLLSLRIKSANKIMPLKTSLHVVPQKTVARLQIINKYFLGPKIFLSSLHEKHFCLEVFNWKPQKCSYTKFHPFELKQQRQQEDRNIIATLKLEPPQKKKMQI